MTKKSKNQVDDVSILEGNDSPTNRIALLFGAIEGDSIQEIIEWIIVENLQPEPVKELTLLINSEGGDLCAAYALIEVMQSSSIPIKTIALGQAASAGILIFMSGTKGRRIATPSVEFMSHHFSTANVGNFHELKNAQIAYEKIDAKILSHYKLCTGLSEKIIREKLICNHDVYLTPEEAVKLHIADKVGSVTF